MKKIYLILGIILILITTGCNGKNKLEEINYEPRNMNDIIGLISEENVNNIITREYSSKELDEIRLLDLNLEDMDKKYRIECIRKDNYYPSSYYKVVYKSNNKFLIICFDENGEKLYGFTTRMSNKKSKFDSIKLEKDKKTKVYLKDLNLSLISELDFLTKHRSNLSAHYTKDGYLITFEYGENGIVIDKKVDVI